MTAETKVNTTKEWRLLVVTHYFVAHGGGIESVAWQLIRTLVEQDASILIEWLAGDCDPIPAPSGRIKPHGVRCWNGLEARTSLPLPIWPLRSWRHLWRGIARSDVVHFHDVAYMGNFLAALLCRLMQKPYFVTQHTGFVTYKNPLLTLLRRWINRVPGRWVLSGAQAVIFISDEVRRSFVPLLPSQNLQLIHNGVNSALFCAPNEAQREESRHDLCRELGLDATRPLLLFVGRFVAMKGVNLLIELSQQMPDVNWIFAGHGSIDPNEGLGANGRVVRGRSGARLAEVYQAADLLLLPSFSEGFPLVVQEALACGTPVLIERAIGEAAPKAKAWMNFESVGQADDAARWKAHIERLLARPETHAMRLDRAEKAARLWDWNVAARQYLALFQASSGEEPKRKTPKREERRSTGAAKP